MTTSTLNETLDHFLKQAGLSLTKAAERSGLPRDTLKKWKEGTVTRPRQWHGLVQLAAALQLTPDETIELLTSAGFEVEKLADLRAEAPAEIQPILARIFGKDVRTVRSPFQAPPDLPYFVGRERKLAEIQKILLHRRNRWCALVGMGGIGKTVLAAHLAHQLRDLFPDGILWARLDSADPMHILSGFAAAYGEDVSHAGDLGSRSQVVRGLLADKQALMILDNVERSADLETLLPATASWAVLLTSRRRDLGMVRRQFIVVDVDPFGANESLALFARHTDPQLVETEGQIFSDMADVLGHHPLALDIIASSLTWEPRQDAASYLRRLQEATTHLDTLRDEQWNVRASLKVSYEALKPNQQSFFAALSVFAGSFNAHSVAVITEQPHSTAEGELKHLYQLSLTQLAQEAHMRYQLHPLLRILAREHLADPWAVRHMVQYYGEYTATYQSDFDRIGEEVENIEGALAAAPGAGMVRSFIQLAHAYYPFLRIRGLYASARLYLEQAASLARESGEVQLLIETLRSLGELYEVVATPQETESLLLEGLDLATQHRLDAKRSAFLLVLGTLAGRRGNYVQAMSWLQDGATAARRIGDHALLGQILQRLSSCTIQMERYEEAAAYLTEGIAIARTIGSTDAMTQLLTNRGELANRRQDSQQARADWEEALTLARQMQHMERICNLTSNLGYLETRLGRYEQARPYLREALEIALSLDHVWHRISLWIYWGEFHAAQGYDDEAQAAFTNAAALNTGGEFPDFQAEILYGLAGIAERRGDSNEARRLAEESLLLAESISYPIVPTVRTLLERLNNRRSV